jgi:hypothetical protein
MVMSFSLLRPCSVRPVAGRGRCFGEAAQPLERGRVCEALGIGGLLQPDASLDGEDQLRHLFRRERRQLAGAPVHVADDPGESLPGAGMRRRVTPVQVRIPRRVHAELDQQQPPVQLGAVAPGRVLPQHVQLLGSGQALGQPRVLRRALVDPLLQQRQEQVGLVAKP